MSSELRLSEGVGAELMRPSNVVRQMPARMLRVGGILIEGWNLFGYFSEDDVGSLM